MSSTPSFSLLARAGGPILSSGLGGAVPRSVLSCLLLGLVASGCGKPATEADCEGIVTRVTELELKRAQISDPVQVQAQINDAKRSFRERALKECVGKRLSKSALDCVAKATDAKQIVEDCF